MKTLIILFVLLVSSCRTAAQIVVAPEYCKYVGQLRVNCSIKGKLITLNSSCVAVPERAGSQNTHLLFTAAHCLAGAHYALCIIQGKHFWVSVLKVYEKEDLALLRSPESVLLLTAQFTRYNFNNLEDCMAVGYIPKYGLLGLTGRTGILTSHHTEGYKVNENQVFQDAWYSVNFYGGMSGGGVFFQGKLVGIILSNSLHCGHFYPLQILK